MYSLYFRHCCNAELIGIISWEIHQYQRWIQSWITSITCQQRDFSILKLQHVLLDGHTYHNFNPHICVVAKSLVIFFFRVFCLVGFLYFYIFNFFFLFIFNWDNQHLCRAIGLLEPSVPHCQEPNPLLNNTIWGNTIACKQWNTNHCLRSCTLLGWCKRREETKSAEQVSSRLTSHLWRTALKPSLLQRERTSGFPRHTWGSDLTLLRELFWTWRQQPLPAASSWHTTV